jgi:hypothetical protein
VPRSTLAPAATRRRVNSSDPTHHLKEKLDNKTKNVGNGAASDLGILRRLQAHRMNVERSILSEWLNSHASKPRHHGAVIGLRKINLLATSSKDVQPYSVERSFN